ncbi:hypothetical protein BO70DRAFT_430745 [Aspergillus heteromorphus CBS 117.55]|uniref:Uncharacterized protein n=1 Tax=Aspergillus heteromorphus CBS 117.55 TaxID=1448321 RepID=A0A317VTS8_9EURO|nr:uncharacterized protein BO70DRAFT_430745 [Aspergillus heteromorphus CBS 117.55]PWY76258.1 hypothetical protein BO70DRAFT_430745 [Aspergillus heteromorphus CBS 117.55]
MTDHGDFKPLWRLLVRAIQNLDPFPFEGFTDELHNKAKYDHLVRGMFDDIPVSPQFPPDDPEWHEAKLAGLSAASQLHRLAIASVSHSVLCLSPSLAEHDNKHVKDRIDATATGLRYVTVSVLHELSLLTGFFDFAKEQMMCDQFIDASVDWDEAKGNHHLFSISVLLMADWLQTDPQTIPGYGPYYWERASYEFLKVWSQRIHDTQMKGDAQKADQLVQWPIPTFDVMNAFYDSIIHSSVGATAKDTEYIQAVTASLKRLSGAEDIVNDWKTYSETLEDTYKTLKTSLWQQAVDATYTDFKWCALYEWAYDSWESEKYLYQENHYELVFMSEPHSRPEDCGQLDSAVVEPPAFTTPIGYGSDEDGSEQEEDEEFCLPGVLDSQQRQRAYKPTSEQCVTLIGFNKGNLFAVSSQAFHTTSGLRAVDSKAAQAHNPYEDIGRLAVGHVVFCWSYSSRRYEHVGITSIEQASSSVKNLEIVPSHGFLQSCQASAFLIPQNSPHGTLKSVKDLIKTIPTNERMAHLRSFPEMKTFFVTHDIFALQKRLDIELFGEPSPPGEEELRSGKELHDCSPYLTVCGRRTSARNGIPLDRLQTHYYLSADSSECPLPSAYQLPELTIVDLPHVQQFEHGLLQIHADGTRGAGVVYLAPECNPSKLVRESFYPFHATVHKHALKTGFNPSSTIKTTFDQDPWPADTEFHQTTKQMSGVDIEYEKYLTEEGYEVSTVRIPLLDKLQQGLNSKFNKSIEPLYRATCTTTKDAIRATVQFHKAPLIPFISSAGLNVNVFDVDFSSKIGVDLTLPVIFQEMVVDIDNFFGDTTGAFYEYDPQVRAAKGTRHIVVGEESDSSSRRVFFDSLRAKVSRALAEYSHPGRANKMNGIPERKLAEITKRLLGETDPDISDLINLVCYEDQEIHDASQSIINDMMFYQMDDGNREDFTTQGKPTSLPYSLADGLSQELKDFLHDKYAPAYLCRSVVMTEKYETKFTDKERKKLWYWWEGNGDKCLAKSKEYTDINSLTTIEAMKQSHRSVLSKFRNDDPKYWADKKATTLQREPVMDHVMANLIREKQNVINKQCCIMNTLSPISKVADQWFQNMVLYSHKIGLEHPFTGRNEAIAEKWLQESLQSLISKTIQRDGGIESAVAAELLDDVQGFEEANDLDQGKSAEERATQMVKVMSPVINEAKTWFSAWEKISDKVGTTINGSKLLKGLFTSSMAAFFVGLSLWKMSGLISDWDSLSDFSRAQVALETLKVATKGVGNAIDAWKVWKGRTASVDLDQLDIALMDQGTDKGVPVEGSGGGKWNEPVNETPDDLPPAAASTAEELSLTGKILKGVNAFLGLGAAIAMAFSLINDWGSMSTVDKILNMLSLVVTTLTVVLDLAELSATVGLFALTTIPVLGQVLTVIGVLLAIVSFFIHLFWPPDPPPPDPIATFIGKTGQPLIASFDDAQDLQLSYDINTDNVSPGSTASITVSARNDTSKDISMSNITVRILTGDSSNCLFSDANELFLVQDTESDKDKPGHVYITPASNGDGTLPHSDRIGTDHYYHQQNLKIAGAKETYDNALGKFVLKSGQSIKAVWTATVYGEKGSSLIDAVENWGDNKSHKEFRVHREEGDSSAHSWVPRLSFCTGS